MGRGGRGRRKRNKKLQQIALRKLREHTPPNDQHNFFYGCFQSTNLYETPEYPKENRYYSLSEAKMVVKNINQNLIFKAWYKHLPLLIGGITAYIAYKFNPNLILLGAIPFILTAMFLVRYQKVLEKRLQKYLNMMNMRLEADGLPIL